MLFCKKIIVYCTWGSSAAQSLTGELAQEEHGGWATGVTVWRLS